ncbi:MAG: single-stranded-DNA-specific exonuclease RecJ [Candidatus Campbellbacteria bacterium]
MKAYQVAPEPDSKITDELAEYPELVRALLFHRGITNKKDAQAFLAPDWERDVHDPFLLKDMEKAVGRIFEAIERGEHIALFSDFDADGIPSAVLMSDFFKKAGYENVSVSIPHRNLEGFGLNENVVEKFIGDGTKLLITLDCGMGDAVHVARAQEHGVDVIVTDHHLPNHDVPKAYAIVNPNQAGDAYPNKNLCGAGVAFKLVQALVAKKPECIPVGYEKWLLDMVGIATLSDMVALSGENRTLAHYGLVVLRKSPRAGLRALLTNQRVNQRLLSEDDVVFSVTPRINAASRMDAPELAFELLSTHDEVRAETLSRHLDTINNERKGAVAQMSKEIHAKVGEVHESAVLVVGNTHWRPGLLGLAAMRAVEVYGKPTFVWGRGDAAVIKGSVRGDKQTNVMLLMQETKELFLEFGGHRHSGGFSITVENLVKLPDALNAAHEKISKGEIRDAEELLVDATLSLDDVNSRTLTEISKLSPFGAGNPKPVFAFESIPVAGIEWFGKEKNHLKLLFRAPGGGRVSAIKFFAKGDATLEGVREGETLTLLGSLEREQFARQASVRVRIVDIMKN